MIFWAAISVARADLTEELNGVVTSYMSTYQIPGVVVGVWQGDTQVVNIADGVSDVATGTAIDEDQFFKIGSVTKSFTVTRILQLADEGSINLNDPISKYVPGVENGTATLRQLANMTSGIFNYTEDATFLASFSSNPGAVRTDAELVGYANLNAPYYAPGLGSWKYSNTNTILLGMVVESVTGHSLQQEITNSILSPLNLTHTVYPNADALLPSAPYVHGYDEPGGAGDSDVSGLISASAFSGAGAMFATMDDLHLWGEALGKGTLLSAEMHAEQLEWVDAGQKVAGPYYDLYGLGIGSINGWIGHTGDQPGYQDLVLYDPATDRTIVIGINLGVGQTHLPTQMFLDMAGFLSVPEPSVLGLAALGGGVIAFGVWARRRQAARV